MNLNVQKKKVIGVLRDNENTNNNTIDPLHTKRRMDWTREWLLKRSQFGLHEKLLPELTFNEIYHFNNFFKMTEQQFRHLVKNLGPLITQQEPQRKRKFFSAEERLAITLKYLATGEVHSCKHYCFKATQNVILTMITDICMKIYENLKNDYLRLPATADDWRCVAKGFYDECQLPNCVGAIEGRHIVFKPAKRPHMRNYAYDQNTIVLLAVVDAYSNFLFADVGVESTIKDPNIFNRSTLKEHIESQVIDLPKDDKLPNTDISIPSFLVGRSNFPLKQYLMKPFHTSQPSNDQLYFNFKMQDVSQKSDHCFEMLLNMFPIFLHPFKMNVENAKKVTLGCIALYNFLRKSQNIKIDEENVLESGSLVKFENQESDDESAYPQRNFLMEYINDNRFIE